MVFVRLSHVDGSVPTFGGEYVSYDDTYQTSGVSYEEVSATIMSTKMITLRDALNVAMGD